MLVLRWRILPSALPLWPRPCLRCDSPSLVPTTRFRVNSNGPRHDVWLLYACPSCDATVKRSVMRRARVAARRALDPYRANDAEAAALWALHLGRGASLPITVEREPIEAPCCARVEIEQPYPCGVRWDALLAQELAMSRSAVVRSWGRAITPLGTAFRARAVVMHGASVELSLGASPRRADPG